jgi:hypothetical protein
MATGTAPRGMAVIQCHLGDSHIEANKAVFKASIHAHTAGLDTIKCGDWGENENPSGPVDIWPALHCRCRPPNPRHKFLREAHIELTSSRCAGPSANKRPTASTAATHSVAAAWGHPSAHRLRASHLRRRNGSSTMGIVVPSWRRMVSQWTHPRGSW